MPLESQRCDVSLEPTVATFTEICQQPKETAGPYLAKLALASFLLKCKNLGEYTLACKHLPESENASIQVQVHSGSVNTLLQAMEFGEFSLAALNGQTTNEEKFEVYCTAVANFISHLHQP